MPSWLDKVGRDLVGRLHEEVVFEMSPRDSSCMVGRR